MLFFLDESGTDLKQAPYEVLAAIAIPEAEVWRLINDVRRCEEETFGIRLASVGYEFKGSRLLKRKTFRFAGQNKPIPQDRRADLARSFLEKAKQLGLKPRARIRAQAVVGTDPVLMLEGPIPGTAAVLKRAGLDLKSIDLFEVNEAFASVVLAWSKETGADLEKTNVNGGAIAVGHPLGASGGILMNRLLYELERRDLRYGLETMCCGGGLGTATIIDRVVE